MNPTAERGQPKAFESFNARFLSAEEVAYTFVPPAQYKTLLQPEHSILVGPRGSGKTTLLKMLQLRSLAAWRGEDAKEARGQLAFHAIFLATDVLWGSQLESRMAGIDSERIRSQIRRTSFRLHLALAYLDAIRECQEPAIQTDPEMRRFAVALSPEQERNLVDALANQWDISLPSRSMFGLRTGIRNHLKTLLSTTEALRLGLGRELPEFSLIDPISSIFGAIDLFNSVIDQPTRRWAILCDELEIAPRLIRTELFQLLRSTKQEVLFKLSLYPYSSDLAEVSKPEGATDKDDYKPLNLSYGPRENAYAFCHALYRGMVNRFGGSQETSPEDAFGEGWFDGGRSHRRQRASPYEPPQGEFFRRAVDLSSIDPSFGYWLSRSKFNIREIHTLSEPLQARYRKALPFILTRSEFRAQGGRHRSRKASRLYVGAYSLFSLSEGNPRTFINLMRPLIERFVAQGGTIATEFQVQSAEVTIHRFRASLDAIPSSPSGKIRTVLDLVEVVGSYFSRMSLDAPFNPEPPLSFIIDDELPPALLELVGRAMNSGAFVSSDDKQPTFKGLGNVKLRLAYTLAPEFKLPLATGRAINLSSIIQAYYSMKHNDSSAILQARLPFGAD